MRIVLDHFCKSFDDVDIIKDMNLTIEPGEMIALLGPSGCGKSTTLFAIAGIHRMTSGNLYFGDKNVTALPPQKRNVGVVFQNYALYPHMSLYDNIAFPLTVQKESKKIIDQKVHEIADLVQITPLLQRKPGQLSGGQQQRVALARALIRQPDILLLDEPLANLDAKLRLEMRTEIRRIQKETGITAILVTHDQVEAMSMCDRIALMQDGKIIQMDQPTEMYHQPKTQFVAGFLGNPPISFLEADLDGNQLLIKETNIQFATKDLRPNAQFNPEKTGVIAAIRPENVTLSTDQGFPAIIQFIEPQGRETLYDLQLQNGALLRAIIAEDQQFNVGDKCHWQSDPAKIMMFTQKGDRI